MRTIAYNVYAGTGFPAPTDATEGDNAETLTAELADLSPEILSFAEAPPRETVESIAGDLGMEAAFFPSRGNWPGAICTTYPILDATPLQDRLRLSDDLFTRHGGRAVIETPLGEILVYSLHLYPDAAAHDRRLREIGRLRTVLETDLADDRPVILQGDLNHPPTAPEYAEWRLMGLIDTYAAVGGGDGKTIKAHDPDRRIDYIWVDPSLLDRVQDASVIQRPPFGPGQPDDALPDRFLSDHLPVSATLDLQ